MRIHPALCLAMSVTIVGCASSPPPSKRVDAPETSKAENSKTLEDAPFLTLKIGPKTLEMQEFTPDAALDKTGLYYVRSGDGDGFHRFIHIVPWNPGVYDSELITGSMRDWKTERGFGIGSTANEVYERIGTPTFHVTVEDYDAHVYYWEYETEFRVEPFPAKYQLTILYKEDLVVGIMIDIDEML